MAGIVGCTAYNKKNGGCFMKVKQTFFILCCLFLLAQSAAVAAPYGGKAASSRLNVTFYSESLDKDMKLNVYLPVGYDGRTNYPVLYMVHAYPFNEDHWFQTLKITEKADELIANGTIEPMIIVAPRIDNSWGINSAEKVGISNGKPDDPKAWVEGMYEDYLIKDVINYVDTHFSTNKSRKGRYIGGASMGGYAALHVGLRNLQLFSKVGGHAPALFQDKMAAWMKKWMFPTDEVRRQRDPIYLAEDKSLERTEIYLDCGDKDDFVLATKKMDEVLSQKKTLSYQFHLVEGGHHDDAYWGSQVENYLKFYGDAGK
jgi:enterochelin esterase-like enzyme